MDIRCRVEIDQLTTLHIDGTETETDVVAFRVYEVEIYEALERRLEQCRIVEAHRLERTRRLKQGTRNPRHIKAGHTDQGSRDSARLSREAAPGIAS